jgi:hypothetical protein
VRPAHVPTRRPTIVIIIAFAAPTSMTKRRATVHAVGSPTSFPSAANGLRIRRIPGGCTMTKSRYGIRPATRPFAEEK